MWSKPDCLISVITCWTFNCVFFRTVSQKRFFFPHGDSHPLDVGLGRAPPVDLPRICSYALAVEKRESIPMQSPRDGQALAQALKVNRILQTLSLTENSIGDPGAEAPGWGGSPMGWMVKFVGKKGSVWEMFWARVSWCLPGEIFGTT